MPTYRIVQLGNTNIFRVERHIKDHRDDEREWQEVAFAEDEGCAALGMDYSGWVSRFDTEEEAVAATTKAWGASGHREQEWRVV